MKGPMRGGLNLPSKSVRGCHTNAPLFAFHLPWMSTEINASSRCQNIFLPVLDKENIIPNTTIFTLCARPWPPAGGYLSPDVTSTSTDSSYVLGRARTTLPHMLCPLNTYFLLVIEPQVHLAEQHLWTRGCCDARSVAAPGWRAAAKSIGKMDAPLLNAHIGHDWNHVKLASDYTAASARYRGILLNSWPLLCRRLLMPVLRSDRGRQSRGQEFKRTLPPSFRT